VRGNEAGALVLTSYGRTSGFCVDPIEKKPLYHFFPGSTILSFGTVGCHLACRHCQNWHLSAADNDALLRESATPDEIARACVQTRCAGVAFTYNDPIPSLEFVVDVAAACRKVGIKTVAVTNGYITPEACGEFFGAMDAANVDLKAFTEAFYHRNCAAHLEPVLETLRTLGAMRRTSGFWLEITNLIIPGENDSPEETDAMSRWIVENLGPDVPLHFSAFRPAYRMQDRPPTPAATLATARKTALRNGLRYVYTGNVYDPEGSATYCAGCGAVLIRRTGYTVRFEQLDARGACRRCGARLPGVVASAR
jgi:pyruvate formate lyase activating enzyme